MFEASSESDCRDLLLVTGQRLWLEAVEGPGWGGGAGGVLYCQPVGGWAPCKPTRAPQPVRALPFIFGVLVGNHSVLFPETKRLFLAQRLFWVQMARILS